MRKMGDKEPKFLKPRDASPELSENKEANQLLADQFRDMILDLPFDRELFHGQVRVMRKPDSKAKWVEKNDFWKGYVLDYLLSTKETPQPIPCELYLGSIGDRGNKPSAFSDGISRFIVIDIGKGNHKASTQYGFYKYLRTEKQALYPFVELKFNARTIPKQYWENIYQSLESFGYQVDDSDSNKSKCLWIGDIVLGKEDTKEKIGNLIEALFAIAIVKAHYKKDKGITFDFLKGLEG